MAAFRMFFSTSVHLKLYLAQLFEFVGGLEGFVNDSISDITHLCHYYTARSFISLGQSKANLTTWKTAQALSDDELATIDIGGHIATDQVAPYIVSTSVLIFLILNIYPNSRHATVHGTQASNFIQQSHFQGDLMLPRSLHCYLH